ncbi:hypothetical protein CR513_41636, partial [Mucuna pruriens]
MEYLTDMCPTLQETESGQPENDRLKGRIQLRESDLHRTCLKDQLLSPQYPAPPFQQQQQQQRVPTQGNSPSLEDLMKQLATNNLEFQQSVSSSNMQFQENMTATIQDLKTQIGQLANTVSHLQSAGSSNLPSQTIPNPRGTAS